MAGYLIPADVPVTHDWQTHRDRDPPSSEPGTDYATAYGTDITIAGDGVVVIVDNSTSGGEGRRLSIDLDDGRRISYIHLSWADAWPGMRVHRGQRGVAYTGASGWGAEWGYDPHVHVTLHDYQGAPYWDSIDFELYVEQPPPPEPERTRNMRLVRNTTEEGGSVRFYTETGDTPVGNPTERDLLHRFITQDPGDNAEQIPIYNNLELDIIASYIHATHPDPTSSLNAVGWAVTGIGVVIAVLLILVLLT